jgi:isoleucyl-tRNA synthetase
MSEKQPQKSQFALIEEEILAKWQKEDTFAKSLAQRENKEPFSFYDGPPFANGLPHFGHSLVTSIKDSLGRYKTMRGYYVARRNGWDCHGLPVEFAIEKQFGISGKKQILELGLDKFNAACRDSVFVFRNEWEKYFDRIGRWTDTKNSYATIDKNYTESVWWTLKQIHDKGLLYRGYKSMPYCPRCETPLSNFEVNEGYKDNVADPSLFVKFKITDEEAYLLGWTTTPWSLPGNAAIAVNPKEIYVYVSLKDEQGQAETLVLAKQRLEMLRPDKYQILRELKGSELVGKSYEPPFNVVKYSSGVPEKMYKVWAADFVDIADGTGVLHVAPAFGEDDLNLGDNEGLEVLSTVDASGHITEGIGFDEIEGMFFKKADKYIIDHLTHKGLVFAAETTHHTYPFCYRCESPLLYYAISTWFVKVSGIKDKLLASAESINWVPEHIKNGRFGKWLEGARDWAVSRNRYWGAPMPVWVNEADQDDYLVIGSIDELKSLSGASGELEDLHRPFIDQVFIKKDGKTYRRVEEVLDCWFESGSMPVAQQHYPFENKELFEQTFPADYIGEGLDQTRLWFYVLHIIATVLFEKPAYRNVLVSGMVLASDGEKLSKRLKNYPPVDDVFANEGADSLRLYLLSNYQLVSADYIRFNRDTLKDLSRNVLGTLYNSFRFFKMYTDIDKWQPPKELAEPTSDNILDQWLLARVNQTITEVTKEADDYRLAYAIQPIFSLIDDLSNWYVRRSRRRFWKSENDTDKEQAYKTLHYCLVRTCQLLAPWAPFISDKLWRELVAGTNLPQSVHLSDWPSVNKPDTASLKLLEEMVKVREYIAEGLAQRAAAKIKVRQPLASVETPEVPEEFESIIAEELNVKEVSPSPSPSAAPDGSGPESVPVVVVLNTDITPKLKAEGISRDLIRFIQNARKNAGFNVEDRIQLKLSSGSAEITEAIVKFKDMIFTETLATADLTREPEHTETIKLDGEEIKIALARV